MVMSYILPPRSLIWRVTAASPIQTIQKTPENTTDDWSPFAIDRNKLRTRQNTSGPLKKKKNTRVSQPASAEIYSAFHTRDPSPAAHRSSHSARPHRHPASGRRVLECYDRILTFHLVQHQRYHFLRAEAFLQGDTLARAPGASSPTRQLDRVTMCPTHSHR